MESTVSLDDIRKHSPTINKISKSLYETPDFSLEMHCGLYTDDLDEFVPVPNDIPFQKLM